MVLGMSAMPKTLAVVRYDPHLTLKEQLHHWDTGSPTEVALAQRLREYLDDAHEQSYGEGYRDCQDDLPPKWE